MDAGLTPVGTCFYNLILLSFQVDKPSLQARLSPPWTVEADEYGNFHAGICEVWGLFDPDGQPASHAAYYYVVLHALATNTETGERANNRYLTLSDRPEDLEKPLTVAATVQHERRVSTRGGDVHVDEEFVFTDADGGVVQAHVAYLRPVPGLADGARDQRVRYPGGEGPEVVFRDGPTVYDALLTPQGINRLETVEYSITVGGLRGLFDGSESVLSVTAMPTTRRGIFRS